MLVPISACLCSFTPTPASVRAGAALLVGVIIGGCTDPVSSPPAGTLLRLEGSRIVRRGPTPDRIERERIRMQGIPQPGGGCSFEVTSDLKPGDHAFSWMTELDPETCEFILARGDHVGIPDDKMHNPSRRGGRQMPPPDTDSTSSSEVSVASEYTSQSTTRQVGTVSAARSPSGTPSLALSRSVEASAVCPNDVDSGNYGASYVYAYQGGKQAASSQITSTGTT